MYIKMSSPFNLLGSLVSLILILSTGWGTGNRSPPPGPLLVPRLLEVAGNNHKNMGDESDEDHDEEATTVLFRAFTRPRMLSSLAVPWWTLPLVMIWLLAKMSWIVRVDSFRFRGFGGEISCSSGGSSDGRGPFA